MIVKPGEIDQRIERERWANAAHERMHASEHLGKLVLATVASD